MGPVGDFLDKYYLEKTLFGFWNMNQVTIDVFFYMILK